LPIKIRGEEGGGGRRKRASPCAIGAERVSNNFLRAKKRGAVTHFPTIGGRGKKRGRMVDGTPRYDSNSGPKEKAYFKITVEKKSSETRNRGGRGERLAVAVA